VVCFLFHLYRALSMAVFLTGKGSCNGDVGTEPLPLEHCRTQGPCSQQALTEKESLDGATLWCDQHSRAAPFPLVVPLVVSTAAHLFRYEVDGHPEQGRQQQEVVHHTQHRDAVRYLGHSRRGTQARGLALQGDDVEQSATGAAADSADILAETFSLHVLC